MSATPLRTNSLPHVLNELASILIVDDDAILREFAKVNLATEAVEIEAAADGVCALEMLECGTFDLLLVDLEMPRMNGFELLERVRQDTRWRHIPVIVVTGREDIASIDRAYQLGATSFTVKPLNWRLISYQIRFVLRAQRAERAAIAGRADLCSALGSRADVVDDLIALCRRGQQINSREEHQALLSALAARLAVLQRRWQKLG